MSSSIEKRTYLIEPIDRSQIDYIRENMEKEKKKHMEEERNEHKANSFIIFINLSINHSIKQFLYT